MNEQIVGSKSFAAVAINCAAKAGEWIMSKMGSHGTLSQKMSSSDLVTEVDKGSEKLIRSLIRMNFPTHSFLGEEGVEPGAEASAKALADVRDAEYLWIVDPIDGTTNFVHSYPFFAVSIALAHHGEVILGVVYDPFKDELFIAEKGKGAYVRGRRMSVSGETTLNTSLVATGFPADQITTLPHNMAQLQHLAPKVRNIRAGGSAALNLAYVAAGRLSGYWESGPNSWDLAAGSILVQESGGRISDQDGTPYHLGVRSVIATNGHIHDELQTELAKVQA